MMAAIYGSQPRQNRAQGSGDSSARSRSVRSAQQSVRLSPHAAEAARGHGSATESHVGSTAAPQTNPQATPRTRLPLHTSPRGVPGVSAGLMTPRGVQPSTPAEARCAEGDTRRQILLLLLKNGPITASELGSRLGLSAVGIRRHLDVLCEEGMAQVVAPRGQGGARGRGRPAKAFQLTDAGRSHFGHDYDTLAVLALQALRETGGDEAIRAFARKRVEEMLAGVEPAEDDEASTFKTAQQLADALNSNGYSTEVQAAGGGVQICQHHCPISHVASLYPELCAAEHEAFAELLGQHVQPLATITDGHGICTTNIPLTPIDHSPLKKGAEYDSGCAHEQRSRRTAHGRRDH